MEWLQGYLTPFNVAAVAVAAAFLVAINREWLLSKLWPKSSATVATLPDSTDHDVADMLAMKRLTARYTRLQCPEGVAAMQTASKHFFHDPPFVAVRTVA